VGVGVGVVPCRCKRVVAKRGCRGVVCSTATRPFLLPVSVTIEL
jgi:hypothetical protein